MPRSMARSLATSPRSHGTMLRVTTQARRRAVDGAASRRDVPCARLDSNLGARWNVGARSPEGRIPKIPKAPATRRAPPSAAGFPPKTGCGATRRRSRASASPAQSPPTSPRGRPGASAAGPVGRHLAAGVVGAAAIATTLAVVFTFIDSKGTTTAFKADPGAGSNIIPVSTTSLTSTPVVGHDVMQLVARGPAVARGSRALDGNGPVRMTGVVLPGGAFVVTAASAVAGASQIDVITASGKRMRGHVVGSDPHSGVAVISTDGGLTPATFADEDVQQNDLDIVVCLCTDAPASSSSGARRPPRWEWSKGSGPGSRSTAGSTSSTPSRPRCRSGRRRGAACCSTATGVSSESSTDR